jgi:hypothetical protein
MNHFKDIQPRQSLSAFMRTSDQLPELKKTSRREKKEARKVAAKKASQHLDHSVRSHSTPLTIDTFESSTVCQHEEERLRLSDIETSMICLASGHPGRNTYLNPLSDEQELIGISIPIAEIISPKAVSIPPQINYLLPGINGTARCLSSSTRTKKTSNKCTLRRKRADELRKETLRKVLKEDESLLQAIAAEEESTEISSSSASGTVSLIDPLGFPLDKQVTLVDLLGFPTTP